MGFDGEGAMAQGGWKRRNDRILRKGFMPDA
jgi:hypothetical protein